MTKEPKKMWRCANEALGYCNGEPDWAEPPTALTGRNGATIPDYGGVCKRDPKTCKKHQTYSQMLEERLKKGAKVAK